MARTDAGHSEYRAPAIGGPRTGRRYRVQAAFPSQPPTLNTMADVGQLLSPSVALNKAPKFSEPVSHAD